MFLLNLVPGPISEVEERGHDLRRDVLDLDDVVVVVPLEELGLDAEDHPVHVELVLAAGAARYDLTGVRWLLHSVITYKGTLYECTECTYYYT